MTDLLPLGDEERAELMAFLDGELKGQAAKSLEARLNNDPRMRAEAEAMKRTWQMLDYLPRPEPSPNFTSKTLTRLSTMQPEFRRPEAPVRKRWSLWLGWAAAVVVSGGIGFGAGRFLSPRPPTPPLGQAEVDQQLTRDLRVLDNLHSYELTDDFPFLKSLADPNDPDLFSDDNSDS